MTLLVIGTMSTGFRYALVDANGNDVRLGSVRYVVDNDEPVGRHRRTVETPEPPSWDRYAWLGTPRRNR